MREQTAVYFPAMKNSFTDAGNLRTVYFYSHIYVLLSCRHCTLCK